LYSSSDNLSSTSSAPNQRRKRKEIYERPERNDDRNKSERLTKRTRERKRNLTNRESECFEPEELLLLDRAGIPEPLSQEELTEIRNSIFDRFHEEIVACTVCNQFVKISNSRLFPFNKVPKKMFAILKPPDGNANSAKPLHPELLKQYDISPVIPKSSEFRHLFQNVLLASNGVLLHTSTCKNKDLCRCTPALYICDQSRNSCLPKLKSGKLPKFAIANGNWVGQLPAELQNMTFGSLSLMRPVQSYGRVTTFQGTTGPGGSSLKGHVYSTPLPTAFVVQKLPIQPSDSVVRVLVVSPFTSDASALNKGKIASTRAEYIIEPNKIIQLHQFWNNVDNEIMKKYPFDEEIFATLPDKDTSPDVFLIDQEELHKLPDDNTEKEKHSNTKTASSGGDSLLRSAEEERENLMISCTVTVREKEDQNGTQSDHSPPISNTSFQASSNTFVVRPAQQFVSDSDPDYLETRYPDLFPFGRAGFCEERKIHISKKNLIAYYTNLSTRQFQQPDFVLPIYDMISRNTCYNMALVRANLPSRQINAEGNVIPRAEAYSRIPLEDLKKLSEYKSECIKNKILGKRAPRPPASSSGLASTFFTDQNIVNQTMQHSQAASQRNRQDVYAAHANNGKASIWLTISPDDAKCFKVMWYALGPKESAPNASAIPQGTKRFKLLSKHPMAAALNFQRILEIVIEDIVGWSLKNKRPYRRGGLFGVPKAWLRVVEEQSRLTLHTHMLIWLYGHSAIENQLNEALKRDEQQHETDLQFTNINSDNVSDFLIIKTTSTVNCILTTIC
jgi:hypothetical protein